jgi:Fibronectin type III domain
MKGKVLMHKLSKPPPGEGLSFNVLIGAALLFIAALLLNGCVSTRQATEVTPSAQAGQVTLAWDANTEPTVGGYQLYYGQTSGNYTDSVDVGKQTSYALAGLQVGKTYYFAIKAYDTTRTIWSGFSNEVSHTIGASR